MQLMREVHEMPSPSIFDVDGARNGVNARIQSYLQTTAQHMFDDGYQFFLETSFVHYEPPP